MKKLLFAIFLLLFAVQGFAQNSGFGLKAGLSSTSVDFKNEQIVPNDSQTGYHLGIYGRFGGGFYIQPELLFTQTSGSFTINSPGQTNGEKFKANFNRLDIPVMFGFRMLKVVRIMAGPIASIDVNSEIKDAANTVKDSNFNSATLGYQAGLGVDIGNLNVDLKYEGGLSSVTQNIAGLSTDNRINQWVLSIGFKLF